MTLKTAASENITVEKRSRFGRLIDSLPGAQTLKNQSIGVRLVIGFGLMILIILLAIALSYAASAAATQNIERTSQVRVPTALASAKAQASLLRMLGDVRGYLALGQQEFRTSYEESRAAFEADLAALKRQAPNLNPENQQRLAQLEATFTTWSALPEQLFELRDDQLAREPAFEILATEGILRGGTVLIELNQMIDTQGRREATPENIATLADMAQFQGSFASMLSGLRGYVTTRNRTFKGEYEANLAINQFAWERLLDSRTTLTASQQRSLDTIAENRAAFLDLPDQIFEVLESDEWRQDLYLFSTEAIPLTDQMQQLLAEMTLDQQNSLQIDLNRGRAGLFQANRQMLFVGFLAVLLGVFLAMIFRENIAGPIRRLTGVAERIRGGDLRARAEVEASDEIGTLAGTFNAMTGQLNHTIDQVRKEKKRADDLLEVVIPIGVELSAEKDFNRLLENMLVQAKQFCHANGGVLYLRREKEESLRLVIVRNNRANIALGGTTNRDITYAPIPLKNEQGEPNHRNVITHVALSGETVNISDTRQADGFDFAPTTKSVLMSNYQAADSMLVIPLKNAAGNVLGVMQLLDPYDPESNQIIPFDKNLQQMMESFSSLAAAALEAYIREQSLKQEIQQLKIEIDESKRKQQVEEITGTDFFADLQQQAQELRQRSRRKGGRLNRPDPDSTPEEPAES